MKAEVKKEEKVEKQAEKEEVKLENQGTKEGAVSSEPLDAAAIGILPNPAIFARG